MLATPASEAFIEDKDGQGLGDAELRGCLDSSLAHLRPNCRKILLVPPDISRLNSYAGPIVAMIRDMFPLAHIDMMPALGTHEPMSPEQLRRMYPGFPAERVMTHRWRQDTVSVGMVPEDFVAQISEGLVRFPIDVRVNRRLLDPSYDCIISIGQVVPHEVAGMSNFNKNIFVGLGGEDIINASHFLGAVYGMERVMGRDLTPPHALFDYAEERFIPGLPLVYALTVVTKPGDRPLAHSLYVGRSRAGFSRSIGVSQKRNLTLLTRPIRKAVVYMDPEEFRTTWLCNKAIYRTRMALADGARLLVIAPGLAGCGEDRRIDELIRRYGYQGRDRVLRKVKTEAELRDNLAVAAHLIHGSSEGRFSVVYAPGRMRRAEIESLGYEYMDLDEALAAYPPDKLKDGWNDLRGEEIFFVSNPALGLWALRGQFENKSSPAC